MPNKIEQFEVVISGPNELLQDMRTVEAAIANLNNALEPRGLSIRTKHWSHATIPGVGSEGQEVVRRQLLENCDILVAMIGTKLGTPTSKHESGTADEIFHMLARDGTQYDNHHVQVYFKNMAMNANDIDISELQRVRDFKEKMKEIGVYFREYHSDDYVQDKIVPSILRAIEVYARKSGVGSVPDSTQLLIIENESAVNSPTVVNEDILLEVEQTQNPGFLDLSVIFYKNIAKIGERLEESNKSVIAMTEYMGTITGSLDPDMNPIEKYKISNKVAENINQTAILMNKSIQGAEKELQEAISSLKKLVGMYYVSNPDTKSDDELVALVTIMGNMADSARHTSSTISEVKLTISLSPNISSKLSNASAMLSLAFSNMQNLSDEIVSEISSAIVYINNTMNQSKD